jgi:hypothetical protein
MNGLPGNLTEKHILLAEERGDNYIHYKNVVYSLEELRKLVNNPTRRQRVKSKPRIDKEQDAYSDNAGTGDVGERSGNGDETGPRESEHPITGGSEGTP